MTYLVDVAPFTVRRNPSVPRVWLIYGPDGFALRTKAGRLLRFDDLDIAVTRARELNRRHAKKGTP